MKLAIIFAFSYIALIYRGIFDSKQYFWILYLWLALLYPQGFLPNFIATLPLSLIAGVLACLSILFGGFALPRVGLTYFLLTLFTIWICFTTTTAVVPEPAMVKWSWVIKSLMLPLLLPFVIRTRAHLEAALIAVFMGILPHVLTAGIKTIFGGGGYQTLRLLLQGNSFLGETSALANVAIATIPIAYYLTHYAIVAPYLRWPFGFFAGYCVVALAAVIGTSARSGLVAMAGLVLMALPGIWKKIVFVLSSGFLVSILTPLLPDYWTNRMATISEYDTEASASVRLEVWKWTIDFVNAHPLGGGFDVYRINEIQTGRAFHSMYFEVLGEQGYPGLLIFLGMLTGMLIRLFLHSRSGGDNAAERNWSEKFAKMLFLTFVPIVVGGAFVGIAYQPFVVVFFGLYFCLTQAKNETIETFMMDEVSSDSRTAGRSSWNDAGDALST